MDAIAHLLRLADAYCAATGLAETTVSNHCFADGKRLSAIRSGSDVGARRLARAFAWFSANWPDAAPWPEGILRPATPAPANDPTPSPVEGAA